MCYQMDEPWQYYAERKKPGTKGQVGCDSFAKECPEQANPWRHRSVRGRQAWVTASEDRSSFWSDGNVLELGRGDGAQYSECTKKGGSFYVMWIEPQWRINNKKGGKGKENRRLLIEEVGEWGPQDPFIFHWFFSLPCVCLEFFLKRWGGWNRKNTREKGLLCGWERPQVRTRGAPGLRSKRKWRNQALGSRGLADGVEKVGGGGRSFAFMCAKTTSGQMHENQSQGPSVGWGTCLRGQR